MAAILASKKKQFSEMSQSEKAVAVAKDVLKHLCLLKLTEYSFISGSLPKGTQLRSRDDLRNMLMVSRKTVKFVHLVHVF